MAQAGPAGRGKAFFLFCLFGASGVLLDADHIIALMCKGLPLTWENLARRSGRPLHVPITLAVWVFSILCSTLVAGQVIVDALAYWSAHRL